MMTSIIIGGLALLLVLAVVIGVFTVDAASLRAARRRIAEQQHGCPPVDQRREPDCPIVASGEECPHWRECRRRIERNP